MTDCSDPSGNENELKRPFSFALFGDRRRRKGAKGLAKGSKFPRPKFQLRGQFVRQAVLENPSKISRAFGRVQFKGI